MTRSAPRRLSAAAQALALSYLRRTLSTRVYDAARETPLDAAPRLSRRVHNHVWIKREDQQCVFSFKLRGAYARMAALNAAQLARGVVCASAGNHAQGVAFAAHRLHTNARIVMPLTTPSVKVEAVRHFGGEAVSIHLHGDSYSDAEAHALALAKRESRTFVHPFDDDDVIAGQGSVATEILRQHSGALDAIFVPVGGGGLLAGVAACVKAVRPQTRIIGVQMVDSDALMRAWQSGRLERLEHVGLFSDGTAVKMPGRRTLRLARACVDDFVRVDSDAVSAAIKDVFQEFRCILEPAGALALAGLKQYALAHHWQGKNLVAIASGANMNFDRLRLIAERAEVGEAHEALFAVTIPEQRGSFRRFCDILGQRNLTEFNYRISESERAHIFVGIATQNRQSREQIVQRFARAGFACRDLTGDELAKQHLRHMVGGHSPLATGERLFSFTLPERTGALIHLLTSMQPNWNISLFHYRYQGGDTAPVLVGLQAPKSDEARLQRFLAALPYPCTEDTRNPAYRMFLG